LWTRVFPPASGGASWPMIDTPMKLTHQ
jgi:hypothetical protein